MTVANETKTGFVPVGDIWSQLMPGDRVRIQVADFVYQGQVQAVDDGRVELVNAGIECPHFISPAEGKLALTVFVGLIDKMVGLESLLAGQNFSNDSVPSLGI